MFFLANSLFDGFLLSNSVGRGIVICQLVASVLAFTVVIGKWRELGFIKRAASLFQNDFMSSPDVLDFYIKRRPSDGDGLLAIYKKTCDRLFAFFAQDTQALFAIRNNSGTSALSAREIELVRGVCEHALDEEEIKAESKMSVLSTVVALAPMLGLLGTVWGVLDAFAEMGSASSANLATIAPAISSALVTTVVGLIVALPGVIAFNYLNSQIRRLTSQMEGFADELIGRIACEFQGRNA